MQYNDFSGILRLDKTGMGDEESKQVQEYVCLLCNSYIIER